MGDNHAVIGNDYLPYKIDAKVDKVCDDLIDFGEGNNEYDTADEENVDIGAIGGTH